MRTPFISTSDFCLEGTKEMLQINQVLEKPSPRKMSLHKKNHLEKDEVIEKDVEKIVAHSSYQTADGMWHVFDHENNSWKTQAEDPKQEFDIEELVSFFNKKQPFFFYFFVVLYFVRRMCTNINF